MPIKKLISEIIDDIRYSPFDSTYGLLAMCFIAGFVALVVDSAYSAWGKSRPVAEFAEQLLAYILHYVAFFLSLAIGMYSGIKTARYARSNAVGWIVGIVVWLASGVAMLLAFQEIPGVGWRLQNMSGD